MRRTLRERCRGCGLITPRCICAALTPVVLPWRLVIVQHGREGAKPTNTARVVQRAVRDVTLVRFALEGRPWDETLLGSGARDGVLLFPSPDAALLDRATVDAWRERPTTLILLDGSWRQARRMARRGAGLDRLPRFALPPGAPSRWTVRRAPHPDQLCTLEALLRVVALLADPDPARALERAFQLLHAAQTASTIDPDRAPPALA